MSFLITISQKELHRLELIQKIRDERLSVVQAADRLDSVEVRSIGCYRPMTWKVQPDSLQSPGRPVMLPKP